MPPVFASVYFLEYTQMISEILAATVESAINALLIVGQSSLCISALIFDSITLNFNFFSFSSTSTCVANLGPSRTIKEKDLCNDYYIYYNTQIISTLLVDDYHLLCGDVLVRVLVFF